MNFETIGRSRFGRTSFLVAVPLVFFLLIATLIPLAIAWSNGEPAVVVIGQSGFTVNNFATTQNGLNDPFGVAICPCDSLWVSDTNNNRVLLFQVPLTTDEAASIVIGQSSFTTSASSTTGSGLNQPHGIRFDTPGNLWVADSGNNRVLEFTASQSIGESAAVVIGQTDFVSNHLATTAGGLNNPREVAFDGSGDLWVSDAGNNRVLEFTAPLTTGESASVVIGQSLFTTSATATTRNTLSSPTGLAFDGSGNLWVSDSGNNRVLEFSAPLTTDESASLVIGQSSFTSSAPAVTSTGLNVPAGIAFDASGNLWVVDADNSRVLQFSSPLTSGEAASVVIGQVAFDILTPATTQIGLHHPHSIAFGGSGSLWVADTNNSRSVEFANQPAVTTTTTSSTGPTTTTPVMTTATSSTSQKTSTTAITSSTVETSSTSNTQTSASSSQSAASGGGIPEFPYQPLAAAALAVLLVTSYLLVRRNGFRRPTW